MKYEFFLFDLWPYFLIACVFIYCNYTNSKYSSKLIFISLLTFSVLRYDVGWDYISYRTVIESGFNNIINLRFEPLSKSLFLIGSYLNFYPVVFAIFSFLTLKIVYNSINKYSINTVLSWLVFYSFPLFFFASLSTLRQSLATVLIFYSYRFVVEKKYIKFFIILVIAMSFHISAIVGILLLPIIIFPISRLINIILLIASFYVSQIILFYINNFDFAFLTVLKNYIGYEEAKPQLINYLYYAFGIFNLLFYNKLSKFNPQNKVIISLINIGLVLFNILSFEPITSLRVSAFFLIFLIYLVPYYVEIFNKESGQLVKNILAMGFLSLSFIFLYMYINNYANGVIEKVSFLPFQFWFNNL